jgi:hypothetical protein
VVIYPTCNDYHYSKNICVIENQKILDGKHNAFAAPCNMFGGENVGIALVVAVG